MAHIILLPNLRTVDLSTPRGQYEYISYHLLTSGASSETFAALTKLYNELDLLKRKIDVLKSVLLLTHPSVSDVEMNALSIKQWNAFIAEFPDEAEVEIEY